MERNAIRYVKTVKSTNEQVARYITSANAVSSPGYLKQPTNQTKPHSVLDILKS